MSISVFISTVSDEFRAYRDQLIHDLTRHNVAVKVQEDFKGLGNDTLDKLDVYIAHCEAVVHLVGEMTGAFPGEPEQQALIAKHPDLPEPAAPRGPRFAPTDQSRAEQEAHLTRLRSARRYPDFTFRSEDELAKHVLGTAILDLLVADYAREVSAARDVATLLRGSSRRWPHASRPPLSILTA
jgi:hypothetical protein